MGIIPIVIFIKSDNLSIHLQFKNLTHWQQITFCAAILERMLPNYQLFSEGSQFGNYGLLRNQLDLIWQWLDKKHSTKINIAAQLNKLEPETPDPQEFDSIGVFPALDACMAMMSLWQLMQTNGKDQDHDDISSVSRLSQNSVSYYVELLLIDEGSDEVQIADISEHPLSLWEEETQNELFDFLKFAAENKRSCQLAKEMVLSEGLSNLGIEISE